MYNSNKTEIVAARQPGKQGLAEGNGREGRSECLLSLGRSEGREP